MAGQIRRAIDKIIEGRAKGNPTLVTTTKAKLTLKGINPDTYTLSSPDDPAVLAKLKALGAELGIAI